MPAERGAPRRWRLVVAGGRRAVSAPLRGLLARGRRHPRRVALACGAGVLVAALVATGLMVVYHSAVLGVRRVRVTGARILATATVRSTAAVATGTPLAAVDLDAVRARVRRLPPVRTVRVERDWPHTLVLHVSERTAVAAVPDGAGGARLVDRTGTVFRTVGRPPDRLPVVRVARPGPSDACTTAALRVLSALTDPLRQRLVRLEAPSPTRIRLVLRHHRHVLWGDASASVRKAQAATALLDKDNTTIDVSAPGLVVVR